jgi:hypothetical protein
MPACDPLLAPLLEAAEDHREHVAARLLAEHAEPIIRQVLRRRLRSPRDRPQDREDVRSEVLVQLVARLAELRADPVHKAIGNLEGYVAVVAYHACDQYLRRRYPQRARLKNRIRYTLTHAAGLDLWPAREGVFVAGLSGWRGEPGRGQSGGRLDRARLAPHAAAEEALGGEPADALSPADLLERLLAWVGHPVELDELVHLVAALLGIRDLEDAALTEDRPLPAAEAGSLGAPLGSAAARGPFLGRLWSEVQLLPARQRAAFLLNLRDDAGGDLLDLFVLTRTATLADLARTLEMSRDELAGLWARLPLPDAEIAGRLAATRQQVINLRKCAKERLARRLRGVRQ